MSYSFAPWCFASRKVKRQIFSALLNSSKRFALKIIFLQKRESGYEIFVEKLRHEVF